MKNQDWYNTFVINKDEQGQIIDFEIRMGVQISTAIDDVCRFLRMNLINGEYLLKTGLNVVYVNRLSIPDEVYNEYLFTNVTL